MYCCSHLTVTDSVQQVGSCCHQCVQIRCIDHVACLRFAGQLINDIDRAITYVDHKPENILSVRRRDEPGQFTPGAVVQTEAKQDNDFNDVISPLDGAVRQEVTCRPLCAHVEKNLQYLTLIEILLQCRDRADVSVTYSRQRHSSGVFGDLLVPYYRLHVRTENGQILVSFWYVVEEQDVCQAMAL